MLRQLSFDNVIREEQERIDRWFSFLKSFFIYCACLFASALCLLAMAIAIYAFIYYLFVPKIEHSFPVYLDYGDTTVTSDSRNSGPAVVAKIPLTARHTQYTKTKLAVSDSKTSQLLQAGQAYTIILEMIVPESPKNINLGPVMLETRLYGRSFSREDLLATSRRPVLLTYRSAFVKSLQNVVYAAPLAFGFIKETQRVSVFALDRFVEGSKHRALNAEVFVHNHNFEVYEVKLKIVAELKGIQYLMYHWFLPSAIIGIGNIFFFELICISIFGVVYMFYFKKNSPESTSHASNPYHNASYSYKRTPNVKAHKKADVDDVPDYNRDEATQQFQKGLKLPTSQEAKEARRTKFLSQLLEEEENFVSSTATLSKQGSRSAEEILREQRKLKGKAQTRTGYSGNRVEPIVKGEETLASD